MKIIESEQVICCDVDETLISWDTTMYNPVASALPLIIVKDPYTNKELYLRPHNPHIYLLKARLERGATVILWSAGGYKWAEAVAKALSLTHERIIYMSKPIAYIDDKPANSWMGEHIYIPIDSKYGNE